MDGTGDHYIEWNRSSSKSLSEILHVFTHVKSRSKMKTITWVWVGGCEDGISKPAKFSFVHCEPLWSFHSEIPLCY
jgi:hypothetical protein